MQNDNTLSYHRNVLRIPVVAILAIWVIYWVEIRFGYNFRRAAELRLTETRTFAGISAGFPGAQGGGQGGRASKHPRGKNSRGHQGE